MSKAPNDISVVQVTNPTGTSPVVLVCEHACHFIPSEFNNLGLEGEDLKSHAAWDPGAFAVAKTMSDALGAALVSSKISRLVYDCNRPPSAPDAMPSQSEAFKIPGNGDLTPSQRQQRAETYYTPFRATLSKQLDTHPAPVIVTLHSFTPVYHGQHRSVEIGFLHDEDSRLADALLDLPDMPPEPMVARNQPYGPQDGVTHTLKEHALPKGHLNIMIEIRNDLLQSGDDQTAMAQKLVIWLRNALRSLRIDV